MGDIQKLSEKIGELFSGKILQNSIARNEITIEIAGQDWQKIARVLRDRPELGFEMLVDVCGVDYLHYGLSEWETVSATSKGFERGVDPAELEKVSSSRKHAAGRFAAVYHLLSLKNNHRLRVKIFLDESDLRVPSVMEIWPSASWFEREAFDLFGIVFDGHPDLRRILTDYGFSGFPFRKDFPLSGRVEPRYDAALGRVIYEPVNITPRVLEPKVIRAAAGEKQ